MSDTQPCLTISYSRGFSLVILFSGFRGNPQVWPEYCFDFTSRILHSKGEFTYFGRAVCFEPKTFRDFAEQLNAIRQGKAQSAEFHEVGHMIEFSISVLERTTKASMRIREYQAGHEDTFLTAAFHVDYDLFVNALYAKTTQFLAELAGVGVA